MDGCILFVQVWLQKRGVQLQQLLERIQMPGVQRSAESSLVRRVRAPTQQFKDRTLQRGEIGLLRFLGVCREIILISSKRTIGLEVFQYTQSAVLGGTPNEGNLRLIRSTVTSIGVSSRGKIPSLLPVDVQSPVLFALWTLRRVFRFLHLLLRNVNALAGASDVFVQDFGAILAEEGVFGRQPRKRDGLGELSTELGDLNEALEIVITNSFFKWLQGESRAILGLGETGNCGLQELFGSNVITDLRLALIEVNELWFLLLIFRRFFIFIVCPLWFTISLVGVVYKSGVISKVQEGKTGPPDLI